MTATLTGVSSMATRQILAELGASYGQQNGRGIAMTSIGGVEAVRRISAGEAFDIVVLAESAMEKLEASGHLVSGSRTGFARSSIAVAVRSGKERPRIDDEEAVKQAVLKARKISYSTGPSGDHLKRLLEGWNMRERFRPAS
jgi:molybdate transport system substrate-binding protein